MELSEKFIKSSKNLRHFIINAYGIKLYENMEKLAFLNRNMQLLWLLTDAWAHVRDNHAYGTSGFNELEELVMC